MRRASLPDRAKKAAFLLCLAPLAGLVAAAMADTLGANPVEAINRSLGDWALRFLLITLAVTPLRELTGWTWLARWRRMLGLYAFFYACLHVLSYVVLDHFFAFEDILADIVKRRYITVGFVAFLLLIPLAVTSTNAMIRRLGGRRWRRLHSLVYAIAALAVLHFYMMVKADVREPLFYAALLGLLLGYRVIPYLRARRPQPAGR